MCAIRNLLLLYLGISALALSAAEEEDTSELSTHAGFSFTSGNSDTSQLNIGLNARKQTEKAEFSLNAYYDYGRTRNNNADDPVTTTNLDKAKVTAQANYILSEAAYAYANFSAEQNEISGIERRITGGPGGGYYLLRTDTLTLSTEGGLVWVFEKSDGKETDYTAFRLAQTFKWKLGEGARIWQDVELVADTSDRENYFFNATAGAEATLTARLALRLEVRDAYNNLPGEDRQQNDITLLSGLTVTW